MLKIVVAAFLLAFTLCAKAQCPNTNTVQLVGRGHTLEALVAANQRNRKEAEKSKTPYIGLSDSQLKEIRSLYRDGDLIYSYEVVGADGNVFSGGTALVRSCCIILKVRGWIA